jgi:hypothetical protein
MALSNKGKQEMKILKLVLLCISVSACSTLQTEFKESDLIGTWANYEVSDYGKIYVEEAFLPTSMYCSMMLDFDSPDSVFVLASGAWSKQGGKVEITIGETWPADHNAHMGELRTLRVLGSNEMRHDVYNVLGFRRQRQKDRGTYWCDVLRKLKSGA